MEQKMNKNENVILKPIHALFWLWIPVAFLLLQFCLEVSFSTETLSAMHSENGPHETVQFILLLAAFITALATLLKINWKTSKWLGLWVALAAICCLYVGGEEVSWGQHFLNWSTPEYWAAINDQNETNLHNTSSWLDQKPRLILLIGVVIGGLVIPALRKSRPGLLPEKFAVIYPPASFGVMAAITLAIHIIDKASLGIFARGSEVVELYLYYFVLMYVIVLHQRIVRQEFRRQL
jgi:hypothetical protein